MKTILSSSIRTALFAAAAICTTTLAPAAALSEMLEKGIYAEETKGDIDAAIGIYEKVLAEAKANQALAAQAQYRLALCYQKKNRTADATAAFERLIKDFPNEKELVASAKKHLPGELALGPVPWVDGEILHATIKIASGLDIGVMAYHARSGQAAGRKTWEIGGRMYAKVHSASRVIVDAETFRPISSTWKHGMLGEVAADYGAETVKIQRADGSKPVDVPVTYPAYDNEQVVHVLRRLPLEVGYKATIPIISTLGGGTGIPISIEVKAREKISVPAGEFESFEVELMPVAQTFWIADDANRYITKFRGGGVTAELLRVEKRVPGAPVIFRDEETGVSLTAPADWLIHRQNPDQNEDSETIYLLDPLAEADNCSVRIITLDSLSPTAKSSARAFADMHVAGLSSQVKSLKVRPDSWSSAVVNGQPAVSFIGDYEENGKPKVLGGVYALGRTGGYQVNISASPEEFARLQPTFENIVASFKTTK